MTGISTDDKYWSEYDGLQHVKHQLLQHYLGGWFPILSSWSGKVLYIDCHAGRGRHVTGHEGSPILALKVLLEHRDFDRILDDTMATFVFLETNETNFSLLNTEIEALEIQSDSIVIAPFQDDYEAFLRRIIGELQAQDKQLAPTFAFVDPYGFTIPMDLLNKLMEFSGCELFINFMYRYVDMAMHNPDQEKNMDLLFGTQDWRRLVEIQDSLERAEAVIQLYSEQLDAEHVTHMYMRGDNNALKYVLIHATNHSRGRELMKDTMWKVKPDGSFTAHERHHPDQMVLISPEPDLSSLEARLMDKFAGKAVEINTIYEWLVGELYLKKHLHQIIRHHRNRGIILTSGFSGRFAFSKNPVIEFPELSG